jgi:hypothetical protein
VTYPDGIERPALASSWGIGWANRNRPSIWRQTWRWWLWLRVGKNPATCPPAPVSRTGADKD